MFFFFIPCWRLHFITLLNVIIDTSISFRMHSSYSSSFDGIPDVNQFKCIFKHLMELSDGLCYATVGVHPCSAQSFDTHPGGSSNLLQELEILALASKKVGTVTAFGEIGLDYDRLFLCPKEQQLRFFEAQLDLAIRIQLPLFLHSRAASADFERLLYDRLDHLPKRGLVHSFTGTVEEMRRLVEMGFDIGVNGCSMKTQENIEVVKNIPLDRLQLETDGPWCEMRASHASMKHRAAAPSMPKSVKKEKWEKGLMVKGRNEPVGIVQVAYAVAGIKGLPIEEVCEAAWKNSVRMFGLGEEDNCTQSEIVEGKFDKIRIP